MDVSLPSAQQQIASDPELSTWVNASAGSGKTTILTKRVVRLLLEGVKPERILCLTFTRAAAAEMAIRVTTQLSEWVTCDDNALSQSLGDLQGRAPTPQNLIDARRLFSRALSCPGGMRIRTLHSFAQEILRRFPIESGLPPHFTVIEENDARERQDDVVMAIMRSASTTPNSKLKASLDRLVCDLDEKRFSDTMRGLLQAREKLTMALKAHGGLTVLMASLRDRLGLGVDETTDSVLTAALSTAQLPEADLRAACLKLADGSARYKERGTTLLQWFTCSVSDRHHGFDRYARCFLTKEGEPYKEFANKAMLKTSPELETVLRAEAERVQKVLERLDTLHLANITEAVITVGTEIIDGYQKSKQASAQLDYDDLITATNKLLHAEDMAPWVLYKLDGGLDHILVDEAQDTSRAQWDIVRILADEFFAGRGAKDDVHRTLFVVGDEKQSIFSFQNADPAAFNEMRGFFKQRIRDAQKPYEEIPLSVSFRSAPAILKAVDAVFASDQARRGVSVEPITHQSFNREKHGRIELWSLLPAPLKDPAAKETWPLPLDYEDEHDPQAELALSIAKKIRRWLDDGTLLAGENRPIMAGDIMILLRRRGRFADLMVRALKQCNVPVTGVDRMRLNEQLAVMDLLAIAEFTLLPEDDLTLATVLRGPILNLSEADLMDLALERQGTLWQSLTAQSHEARFSGAHTYLAGWLSIVDFITPFAMLARLLNEPCPASPVSGRKAIWTRLGPDALDPVEELLNAAQLFSRRHAPSLQHFLHWLSASDNEIKRELDSGTGQVRIMTVHAAKGLEAPIVFLPDTVTLPRVQDLPKLMWTEDGLPLYLNRRPQQAVARQVWMLAREKQLEEYRRLLYVALTRAANQLYIGGWELQRREPDHESSWYNLVQTALEPLNEPLLIEGHEPVPALALADAPRGIVHLAPAIPSGTLQHQPLPAWAYERVSSDEPTVKAVAASAFLAPPPSASPDVAFARGRIIHRLLQSLPDIDTSRQENAARRYLANPQHRLTIETQTEIVDEVLKLLNHAEFKKLFGPASRAEVPLISVLDGRRVSGQVDRLCLLENEAWIVDYKTNRPPPDTLAGVPLAYLEQLKSYRVTLSAIYPTKTIRCFLLWTYKPYLMEIPA